MMPVTKIKGDFGATKAVMRLVEMGYVVFSPIICESLPFDLIAYKDGVSHRIQAKYSGNGNVSKKTVWNDKHGSHVREYLLTDFDYYAIYLPDIDKVVFPSVKLGGINIHSTLPNTPTKFYWWDDFKDFTDTAVKHSCKEFGYSVSFKGRGKDRIGSRKVVHPSKEELDKLIWEKPTIAVAKDFGVSDKAVERWVKKYELTKPPRGYWAKIAARKPTESLSESLNETPLTKPTSSELQSLILSTSLDSISAKYEVTNSTIYKWIREFGLTKPPRNAWKKSTKQPE